MQLPGCMLSIWHVPVGRRRWRCGPSVDPVVNGWASRPTPPRQFSRGPIPSTAAALDLKLSCRTNVGNWLASRGGQAGTCYEYETECTWTGRPEAGKSWQQGLLHALLTPLQIEIAVIPKCMLFLGDSRVRRRLSHRAARTVTPPVACAARHACSLLARDALGERVCQSTFLCCSCTERAARLSPAYSLAASGQRQNVVVV
jgi:hypothetical protein